jgi:S-adenosylmethionine:tRNA ribosyltransferase-isomerase
MRTDDLDFDLPEASIATRPAQPRDSARLMVIYRDTGKIEHRQVRDLPTLGILQPGDVMVVNDTRVLPAYLEGTRLATGGKVTGLYVESVHRPESETLWRVMLESRGTLNVGEQIAFGTEHGLEITLHEKDGGGCWLAQVRDGCEAGLQRLQQIGQTPLPPYIRKARRKLGQSQVDLADRDAYNTVYATSNPSATLQGSVAAPTAGLHFTDSLLQAIDQIGVNRVSVSLQVGMGTFLPVRTGRIEDHTIHREAVAVPTNTLQVLASARAEGRKILPVGTTSVRCLESLPEDWKTLDHFSTQTDLFITPGFGWRFTDGLMTNFHLPRSTLLALVAALPDVGVDRLLSWYRMAIDAGYRFYSYGDAMLII